MSTRMTIYFTPISQSYISNQNLGKVTLLTFYALKLMNRSTMSTDKIRITNSRQTKYIFPEKSVDINLR